MSSGFAAAFSEITLVLFTTLAPSGAVAYALMSLPIVKGGLADDVHRRIDKALAIPLIATLIGLVASATHLGNPANALYVFMGVGRSPLSNEVFCAVVFLAFAGVYWLYSFAVKPNLTLQRVLAACACAGAIVCVTAIAFAYSARTIVSWDTPFSPVGLWLNALIGGPVLAIVGLRFARWKSWGNRYGCAMIVLAVVALAACVVVYGLQGAWLASVENSVRAAFDLVPSYAVQVTVFVLFSLAGIVVDAIPLAKALRERASSPSDEMTISIARAAAASALVFAGIFTMRFSFYMMHMTVGISV